MSRKKQAGFTIIELMIATLVFSTVLLLCAAGLIAVGRMYQKGNTSRAVQETTRSITDQIKNDFELSGGYYQELPPDLDENIYSFCIGGNIYTYELGRRTTFDGTGSRGFVVEQSPAGCTSHRDLTSTTAQGLLGPNMRVAELRITPYPTADRPTSIGIYINIVAGEDDLLTDTFTGCRGGAGQEYCANAILETYATRKLQ